MNRKETSRKQFLTQTVRGVGLSVIGGTIWSSLIHETKTAPLTLRPPAAIKENDFLNTCLRCGLCVEACPYDTLELAKPGDNIPLGTPHFLPRKTPCYLCEDVPCVNACPSKSLNGNLIQSETTNKLDVEKSQMGVAVVDEENCIASWGIQCDACYRACPLMDKAISLSYERNERTGKHAFLLPKIDSDNCTGCGLCEHACVTEKASIFVLPSEIAQGKVGTNYIKGWEQQDENRLREVSEHVTTQTERSSQSPVDYLNSDDLFDE